MRMDQCDSSSLPLSREEVDQILKHVEKLLRDLDSSSSGGAGQCHPILLYGLDGRKLRLIEFILAQRISRNTVQDVHLIRSGHLPNLIHKSHIGQLVPKADGHYLSFFKLVYLYDHRSFVDHLLKISAKNRRHLLPVAFIVDNVNAYLGHSASGEEAELGPWQKRLRAAVDQHMHTLVQLCSLLVETIEYCASKLKRSTFLVISIDLTTLHEQEPNAQRKFIAQIQRRFFNYHLDVDHL